MDDALAQAAVLDPAANQSHWANRLKIISLDPLQFLDSCDGVVLNLCGNFLDFLRAWADLVLKQVFLLKQVLMNYFCIVLHGLDPLGYADLGLDQSVVVSCRLNTFAKHLDN